MQWSITRPPLQLALSAFLAYRIVPTWSVPLITLVSLVLYILVHVFIVFPFRLFVYSPILSPWNGIPSPPPGLNTWKTWFAAEPTPPQLLAWVNAATAYHGDKFRGILRYYGIGGQERILLTSSEALREVLVQKQYQYFDRPALARKRIALQAGNGLIASSGGDHKNQKRSLLPAFSTRAVKDLYPCFYSKANELVAELRKEINASEFADIDIVSWASRSALDIVGVAAWGRDFHAISEPDSTFLKSYSGMFDVSGGGQLINALALALPMSVVFRIPCAYNTRLRTALKTIRTRCAEIVREKKKKVSLKSPSSSHQDILSLLMEAGVVEEKALIDQMMTILAAGHDTSGLSLSWACYLLCKNANVQSRLREELRTKLAIGPNGFEQELRPESLESLEYLNAVANEVLRLMPPVPIARREALQATRVQGIYIPQGGHIVTSSYVSNRLESQWVSDAEQFVPERWLAPKDLSGKVDKERSSTGAGSGIAFHSFSHGPRACIGQGFARAELLVFIAALVGSFELELKDPSYEPSLLFGITMSPLGEIKLKIKPSK